MSETVSTFMLKRLGDWGVERIFGYPGDGINGFMSSLDELSDDLKFIQTRHEEMAAFMAVGQAKFDEGLGVCMATSGPGAVHLLNGLYDAKLDHVPVLAIVGQQASTALGGNYQQEIDLTSLFKDVAGEYVHMLTTPSQAKQLIDRAARIALSERCPTCIIVPNDLQSVEYEEPAHAHGTVHTSVDFTTPVVVPEPADLERAAEILNSGERVAILVGRGATGAADEIAAVADKLGAGVAKALLGKDVISDFLPYVTGSIGLLGTKPSWDMMMECDTLLMVGTSFPYSEFLPKDGQARGVQIDLDGRMIGMRHPNEANLVGDAKATLAALLPALQEKESRAWREKIEQGIERWWHILDERAKNVADPINPQFAFSELSDRLPDDVILTSDSGSVANWYARDLRLRQGMRGSLSGTLATMGPGVPYAIGAKFAHPDRPVIALVGDGAMQMNGNAELVTIAKYWKEWEDPRLIVMVLNNRDLNQVTWEQRAMEGNRKFTGSQSLPDFHYADYAHLIGLDGVRVEHPEQLGAVWDSALNTERPFVMEVMSDPNVPPLPPHITIEQARAFMSSIVSGDPDSAGIVKQSFKDKIEEFVVRH